MRLVGLLVLSGAMLFIFTGCGKSSAPDACGDKPHEIVLWSFGAEDCEIRQAREVFDALKLENTILTVRRYGFEEIHEKLLSVFAAGGKGAPDLCEVEISQIGRFFKQDPIGFADLTDLINNSPYSDDLIRERLEPYTYKGRVYGIDVNLPLSMLYYRHDLFEKFDIPTSLPTWDGTGYQL